MTDQARYPENFLPALVRIGTHRADLRYLPAIPRIGESVNYGHPAQPRDWYTVEDVLYTAWDPDPELDGNDVPITASHVEIVLTDPTRRRR